MFMREDNNYNEIRDKSLNQWLDEMEKHEDVAVRSGVKLAHDYIESLKKDIANLKEQGRLKDDYLKQMRDKVRELQKTI